MSTFVETVSGSVYYIREVEKFISGGFFRSEFVRYEKIENLTVGESMIIRTKDCAAVQSSAIKKIVRGTTTLA